MPAPTQHQVAAILALAGEETASGKWRWTFSEIAAELRIPEQTVRDVIRRAAVCAGELEAGECC